MEMHFAEIAGGAIALVLVFSSLMWPLVVMAREWPGRKHSQ